MKRPLTMEQAHEVLRAADMLPPPVRAQFISEVDDRLRDIPRRELSDDDIGSAILSVLSGINIAPCDSAEGA
jgi:hypothetical protein